MFVLNLLYYFHFIGEELRFKSKIIIFTFFLIFLKSSLKPTFLFRYPYITQQQQHLFFLLASFYRYPAETSRLLAHYSNLQHTRKLSHVVSRHHQQGQEYPQGGKSAENDDENEAEKNRAGGVVNLFI